MNLDDRARKAAAAVHDAVRDVSPERVPVGPRMPLRPVFRYAPSLALVALIVTAVVLVRTLPDRTSSAGRLGALQARISVSDPTDDIHAITYASGHTWVLNSSDAVLSRIDARTNQIVATINVGPDPSNVAVGFEAAWVSNYGNGTVSRVDLRTNAVTTIGVGSPAKDVATGSDAVWVATLNDKVVRIDPATRKVTRTFSLGYHADSIEAAGGSVWVGSYPDGFVRLDPRNGATKLVAFNSISEFKFRLTRDGKTLWAAGASESTDGIYRMDTRAEFPLPEFIADTNGAVIDLFGGEVWGLSADLTSLVRLDADTGRVRERFRSPASVVSLAVGANSLWITTVQGTVLRYSLG